MPTIKSILYIKNELTLGQARIKSEQRLADVSGASGRKGFLNCFRFLAHVLLFLLSFLGQIGVLKAAPLEQFWP
jgi:hypothetical protein